MSLFLLGTFALVGCDGMDPEEEDPDPPPETQNSAPDAALTVEPSDEEVETGTEVTLDASGSSDPDGDQLSFSWTLTSQPAGSETAITPADAVETSFTPDVEGAYEIGLEVSDGDTTDSVGDDLEAVVPVNVVNTDITKDTTWTSDNRIRVEKPEDLEVVTVREGVQLTIEPGTEVRFAEEAGLATIEGGSIEANGTAQAPIFMTGTTEERGWWAGVGLSGGDNVLSHVRIQHTGFTNPNDLGLEGGAVRLSQIGTDQISLTLESSILEESSGGGLVLENEVQDTPLNLSVSDTEFRGLEGPEVKLPLSKVGKSTLENNNDFSEGSALKVEDAGSRLAGESTVLPGRENARYRIDTEDEGDVIVQNVLQIEPGANLTFGEGDGLTIGVAREGNLIAEGTSSNPITMSATEGNGQQGWWDGLTLKGSVDARLQNVIIRHGGRNFSLDVPEGNVRLVEAGPTIDNGRLTIQNSTLEESGRHGIACESAGFQLDQSGNSFDGIPGENVSGCE